MTRIALPDKAKSHFIDTLFSADGAFPHALKEPTLSNTRTFLPKSAESYDENRLLDFNRGGIADQKASDLEMFSDIREAVRTANGSLIYFDHWSHMASDLIFEYESNVKTSAWMGHVFHFINFDSINFDYNKLDLIGEFRSNSIGYLKIIFTTRLKFNTSRVNADALFLAALNSAMSFYISCYDDESWMAADLKHVEMGSRTGAPSSRSDFS